MVSKEYPCINFYIPEWFRIRGLSSKEASIRKEESLNTYIFIDRQILNKMKNRRWNYGILWRVTKDLIEHKIYSAWQFIEYTQENINIANYCVNIINKIIDKLEIKTDRWQEEMETRFYDDTLKNGTKVKRLSIKQEDLPTYEIRVAGEKLIRGFYLTNY